MKSEDKRWAVGMLFLGTLFGLIGGLMTGVFERYFLKFGVVYDLFVTIVFLSLLVLINYKFKHLLSK